MIKGCLGDLPGDNRADGSIHVLSRQTCTRPLRRRVGRVHGPPLRETFAFLLLVTSLVFPNNFYSHLVVR